INRVAWQIKPDVPPRQERPFNLARFEHTQQRTGLGITLGKQQHIKCLCSRNDNQIGLSVAIANAGCRPAQAIAKSVARLLWRPTASFFMRIIHGVDSYQLISYSKPV